MDTPERWGIMPLIALLMMLGWVPSASASEISQLTVEYSTTTAPLILQAIASKFEIDATAFIAVAECESHFIPQQSRVPLKGGPNGRENSWGIYQINLSAHPDVTRAQAMDPWFAAGWSAKKFKDGEQDMWTCSRKLFGRLK